MGRSGFLSPAENEEEQEERNDRDDRHPPVHDEHVDNRDQHRADCASQRGEKVGGEIVQGANIVLHRLFHFA
ncbi:hypothetical protein D3C71_1886320 [compost metagenome]